MKIEFGEDSLWISTENQAEYFLLKHFLRKTRNPQLIIDDDDEGKEEFIIHLEFEGEK